MNWSGLRPVVHRLALLNDPEFLNQIVTRFLQQFIEAEIPSFLQAEPYQRTDERTGYRNGYKPRILKTRVGRRAQRCFQCTRPQGSTAEIIQNDGHL